MHNSAKKVGPDTNAPFDSFVCIAIVVVACILVIAGRPDGLAITISAFIVAACAVVCRCVMRTRSVVANMTRAPAASSQDVDHEFSPTTFHPSATGASDNGSKRSSWLRESD